MIRQTSIEAYNEIKREGLLGELQFMVYEALFNHGPLTQGELWERCFKNHQRHTIAPRFAELFGMGVIKVVRQRPCAVTGRSCLVWDVTDQLPDRKGLVRVTKDSIIASQRATIAELQATITRLQLELAAVQKHSGAPVQFELALNQERSGTR